MKRSFTNEDIIRFLYNEMPDEEAEQFLDAVCVDEKLWERYEYYQNIVDIIPKEVLTPSSESVDSVMTYVASTNSVKQTFRTRRGISILWFNKIVSLNAFLLLMVSAVVTSIIGFSIYKNIQSPTIDSAITHQHQLAEEEKLSDSISHSKAHSTSTEKDLPKNMVPFNRKTSEETRK